MQKKKQHKSKKVMYSMITHPYCVIPNILLALTPLELKYIYFLDFTCLYLVYLDNPYIFTAIT